MSVSDNHNQMISHDGESGTRASRILTAMVSNFTSARGRFILASLCMMFLTYLLLSQDPWWLFRAFPEEAARKLKHGVIDKVYHLVAYFGATCVLMWYAAAGSRRMFYGLAAVITCHAFVTEFLQQFVPRRTTDVDDLFANLVGVSAGVVAGILIRRATFTPNDSRNGDSLPDSARSGNALARTIRCRSSFR